MNALNSDPSERTGEIKKFISPKELNSLFTDFQRSAFRLECLPEYDALGEREEYRSYRDGAFLPYRGEYDEQWITLIQDAVKLEKTMTRVRLIPEPLTTYIRYEIEWGYVYTAAAGEKIFMISQDLATSLVGNLPNDFWLFDNRRVADMQYDINHVFLGALIHEDPLMTENRNRIAQTLLAQATPLREYLRATRAK